MKRTINYKAVIIICCIPVSVLLAWLIGVIVWNSGGKNNPALWTEIHNQPFLNNLVNGFLVIFCLAMSVLIVILIGFVIRILFNWLFPKVDGNKRGK